MQSGPNELHERMRRKNLGGGERAPLFPVLRFTYFSITRMYVMCVYVCVRVHGKTEYVMTARFGESRIRRAAVTWFVLENKRRRCRNGGFDGWKKISRENSLCGFASLENGFKALKLIYWIGVKVKCYYVRFKNGRFSKWRFNFIYAKRSFI